MDWNSIEKEIKYSFSRPTRTGGQYSYKMETRVKLQFDVLSSKGLTHEEKIAITSKFDHITSKKGILALNADRDRSQLANKIYVTERLQDMLTELFKAVPKRISTKRPSVGNEDRLDVKHRNAARKVSRKKPEV